MNLKNTRGKVDHKRNRWSSAATLMLAVLPAAALFPSHSVSGATTDTWTGGVSGDWATVGNWNTTNGSGIPATGDTLVFTGTSNLNTTDSISGLSVAGLTFNATAGNFTLGGTNALTLTGAVNNTASGNEIINLALAGTAGLNYTGPGTLVLGGANTYTGGTVINSGTIVVNAGGNLGAATNALTLGTTVAATGTANTAVGSLVINTNTTVGTLTASTFNTAANTLTINGTNVMTVNGNMTVGVANSAATTTTALTVTGNELDLNANLIVGLAGSNGSNRTTNNLDMSGLTTFKMTTANTGAFNFGTSQQAGGTVKLAAGSNTITTGTIAVSATTANAGSCTLDLGAGTNTIAANAFNIGTGKGTGVIQFLTSTGSVSITGFAGGTSTANFTIGSQTSATGSSTASAVLLAGHSATIQAGTVIVAQLAGATGGAPTGCLTFDTGNFSIATLQMGNDSSGTTGGNITANLTVGGNTPNNTATGVMTIGNFSLANITNTAGNATLITDRSAFTLNGGTVNVNSDITATRVTACATLNTSIQLSGGTLNMNGHAIGPVAGNTQAINTITLPAAGQTATLSNLGGTGINASGLTMNGNGTLILASAASYTNATTVSSGTLDVTGTISASSGVTVNGGLLNGSGSIAVPVVVSGGNISGGDSLAAATGTLSLSNGLTLNSGNINIDIGTSTSNVINVTAGSVLFNSGSLVLGLGTGAAPLSGSTFNVFTSNSALSLGGLSMSATTIGRTTLTPSIVGNNIVVTVSGNPANLVWNNAVGGGDGTTWDTTQLNWSSSAPSNPNQYFDGDNVTFNDANNSPTNANAYNVQLNSTVQPASVTVNTANTYNISGSGAIAGSTGLSVTGGGTLNLSTINTYTGNTSVNGGSTLAVTNVAAGSSNLGAATSTLVLNNGGIKFVGTSSQTDAQSISIGTGGATFDSSPNTTASGVQLTYTGAVAMTGTGSRVITFTGTDPQPLAIATQAFNGTITDNGGATSIVKNGNNRWQLGGTNTFTGGITINAGGIRTGTATALGSGNITVASGAQLYLNVANATYANNISIAGVGPGETGTVVPNNFGALRLAANTTILTGTITLAGDARISARSATGAGGTITGQITGAHALEFGNAGGAGILTISNLNNNWTGDTTISLGTVKLGATGGATGGAIPHGAGSGNVIINGGDANGTAGNSTLDLNGFSTTINGLSSAGNTGQDVITNSSTASNAVLSVGDNNIGSSYSGLISDGASKTTGITKIGTGTLVLGGSNTFSGGLTVNGGTVQAASGSAFGSGNNTVIVNTGTADLNGQSMSIGGLAGAGTVTNSVSGGVNFSLSGSTNSSFSGAIQDGSGSVSLTKSGSATQTLAGTSTYSGTTAVNGGTLNVTGSLLSTGTVNVGGGATLAGTGSVGNVNLSGGTISPAGSGVTGTLTMSSLTTSGGTLQFDLISGLADQIVVNGAAALDSSLNLNIASSTVFATPGTYVLLTSTNLSGTPLTFTHPTTRQTYTLDYNNITANGIDLIVGATTAANLVWTGAQDGSSWDTSTLNWKNGASADKFFQFDNVTFDDTASPNYNVNLTTALNPTSVTVNTTNTYTFSGSGSLTGNASVTLTGGGNLALNNTGGNNYTGGTFVQNGNVILGNGSALTGNYVLGNGTTSGVLDLNGNSVNAVNVSVSGTGTNNVVTNNGGGLATITGAANAEIDAPIVDGTSQIAVSVTAGTLTLGGNSTYSGGTTVASGATLQIGAFGPAGSVAGPITDNGTVSFAILNGAPSNGTVVSNVISGSGAILQRGNSATILTGNNTYTGTTTVNTSGFLYVGNGGTTGTLGTGNAAVNGTLVFNRSDATYAVPNVLNGNGTITYEGGAVYTSTAANAFTGAINILSGTTFDGTGNTSLGAQASTGVVTVASGATFDDTLAPANVNFGAKQFSIAGTGTAATPAALYNSGTAAHTSAYQKIALSADATVFEGFTSTTSFARDDLRNGGPVLDLGGHTLTKTGGGQFTLVGGTLTGGGTFQINQGVFSFQTSSHTSGTGNVIVAPGADMEFYQTAAGNFTWNISTTGDATVSSANTTAANVNGDISFTGNLSVGPTNGPVGHNDAANDPLNLLGNVTEFTGGSSLVKFGVDTVTLSGTNAWTGNTVIGNGTVKLGSATGLPSTSPVVLGDAGTNVGTLDLNGNSPTIAGLSINAANTGAASSQIVTNSSATTAATLTFATGTSTFGGVIQDGAAAGGVGLTVSSGSLTLTNADSYTGATTVNAGGTLAVASSGSITSTTPVTNNGTLNFANASQSLASLNGTTSTAALNINATALTLGGGTYAGSINDNGTLGSVSINSGVTQTTGSVNVNSLTVNGTEKFTNTTIRTLSKVNTLTVAGGLGAWTGGIDLTNSRLIVEDTSASRAADIAMYKNMIANNAGNTVGIYSSTAAADPTNLAVVVSDNAIRMATFSQGSTNFGTGVNNVDANSILITTTIKGDFNLDGVVDLKDLQDIANHWQQTVTDWSQGDVDGNGKVELQDLQAVANHWQAGVGAPGAGSGESFSEALSLIGGLGGSGSNVPEPASLALLGVGGAILATRRRRKV